MSQRELASLLQVRPSFLSAIENGRSRIPEEKLERLKDIFKLESLDEFMIEEQTEMVIPPHIHSGDNGMAVPQHTHSADGGMNMPHIHSATAEQSESITRLLNHFHDLAHQHDRQHGSVDEDMAARIDYLEKRNDRLSQRVDDLRDEVDRLREENLHLKELLIKNNLPYS